MRLHLQTGPIVCRARAFGPAWPRCLHSRAAFDLDRTGPTQSFLCRKPLIESRLDASRALSARDAVDAFAAESAPVRPSMTTFHIFGVLFLIAVNAFFAAVEFSLVAVRFSRVRQLVEQGDPRAKVVEILLRDLSRVVSGVQVGIAIATLALGYLGEITLASILGALFARLGHPWATMLTHATALVIVFGILTVLQVVFGELVPKSLSLARAERVALLVAVPFHWFLKTFSWAIDLLDTFAEKVVRAMGVVTPHSHTLVGWTEE